MASSTTSVLILPPSCCGLNMSRWFAGWFGSWIRWSLFWSTFASLLPSYDLLCGLGGKCDPKRHHLQDRQQLQQAYSESCCPSSHSFEAKSCRLLKWDSQQTKNLWSLCSGQLHYKTFLLLSVIKDQIPQSHELQAWRQVHSQVLRRLFQWFTFLFAAEHPAVLQKQIV